VLLPVKPVQDLPAGAGVASGAASDVTVDVQKFTYHDITANSPNNMIVAFRPGGQGPGGD